MFGNNSLVVAKKMFILLDPFMGIWYLVYTTLIYIRFLFYIFLSLIKFRSEYLQKIFGFNLKCHVLISEWLSLVFNMKKVLLSDGI